MSWAATPALCIGVAGGSGSGKTTVAAEIVRRVGTGHIAVLHQDRYYRDLAELPFAERAARNFDHPDAIEVELLVAHLTELKAGRPVAAPVYDFEQHVRRPACDRIEPQRVVVVEGILPLALAEVRQLLDVKIFVDTDPDVRFIRRLRRDLAERGRSLESVVSQYERTVRPMHLEFVEPSKRWADVIIPEGGHNTVALDLVISRIERLLGSVDGVGGTR